MPFKFDPQWCLVLTKASMTRKEKGDKTDIVMVLKKALLFLSLKGGFLPEK